MNDENKQFDPCETIALIEGNQLDAKTLEKRDRQQCVDVLRFNGMSQIEISKLMKVSVVTINNDVKELKEDYAKEFKKLKGTLIPEFFQKMSNLAAKLEKEGKYYQALLAYNTILTSLMNTGDIPRAPKELKIESNTTSLHEYILTVNHIESKPNREILDGTEATVIG